jgi:hypothetical protein
MKTNFLLICITLIHFTASAQPSFLIHFGKNSYALDNEAKKQLAILKKIIAIDRTCFITVTGRADSDGDSVSNSTLAEGRIDAVMNYLSDSRLPEIKSIILGENKPIVPNTSEKNKKENRSVLVELKSCGKDFNMASGSIRIIDQLYGPDTSTFEFDSRDELILKTAAGTYINIPDQSFCDNTGKIINGKVTFHIREFQSYPDMIFSGITMNSNEKILQSGGFVNLNATNNDKELQVRFGKSIQLTMNDPVADTGMRYFIGVPDETKSINWVLSKNENNSLNVRNLELNCSLLYAENISRAEQDTVDSYIGLLTRRENEDLAAKLIAAAVNEKNEFKLNRLIHLLHLEHVWFGLYDSLSGLLPAANIYLYKSYTQREVKFNDDVFAGIDFSRVNVLGFEMNGWRSSDFLFDTSQVSEIITVRQYLISTNRLRFINIDKFLDVEYPVQLAVNIPEAPPSTVVRLIFLNSRSILAGDSVNGRLIFPRLPANEPAVLLAYSVYNGELSFTSKSLLTGKETNEVLYLSKGNFSEFRELCMGFK